MKPGIRWIDRSLLTSPLWIGICFDERSLNRELRRLDVPRSSWPGWVDVGKDAHVVMLENPTTGQMVCVVCISFDGKRSMAEVVGLLAHEAAHVWQAIREDIGEDHPSDEFEAYSIQNITQRLIREWVKMGKKKCKGKGGKGK
mgnify:CR=1 FL=1